MYQNKTFHLISHLNAWDKRNLEQFLLSPFFNRRQDVIALYRYMRTIDDRSSAAWDKRKAWDVLHPGKSYDDQEMRLLSSYLYRLIEQFLSFRELKKDKTTLALGLAKAYKALHLEPPFKKTIKVLRERLNKASFIEENYLRYRYEVEYEYYSYVANQQRADHYDLQPMTDSFDHFYIAGKLKHACLQIAHQAIYKKEYESGLLNWVLDYVEQHPNCLSNLAIAVYYYCYKSITSDSENIYFDLLRRWINAHGDEFNRSELANICLLAINYCIRKLNTGEERFARESFDFYRLGIEKGFLFENEPISPFNYRNISFLGIMLGEMDWVESFIVLYKDRLPANERSSMYSFCIANLRYSQKRYEEAMKLLNQFDSNDRLLSVSARMILIRIYFEIGEFIPLESLLLSLYAYLNRHKDIGYHRQVYLQVIAIIRKLLDFNGESREDKNRIKAEIETVRVQNLKKWLLAQMDKL